MNVLAICLEYVTEKKNAVNEYKTMLDTFASILFFIVLTPVYSENLNGEVVDNSPLLLMGSPAEVETSKMQFSFKVWQNPRKSAFKPRKRDLHEPKLLLLMGNDYDHKWMRKTKEKQNMNGGSEENERKAVRALRALVDNSTLSRQEDLLQLPEDLPSQYHELVKNWLVRRATCPIRFTWNDLGPYFWPRYVKLGECLGNMTCSWPPGMSCAPGAAKILNILRWHCRERKTMKKGRKRKNHEINNANSTNTNKNGNKPGKKRKRKKYRCMWIKVPYPVPEDCVCSCGT